MLCAIDGREETIPPTVRNDRGLRKPGGGYTHWQGDPDSQHPLADRHIKLRRHPLYDLRGGEELKRDHLPRRVA